MGAGLDPLHLRRLENDPGSPLRGNVNGAGYTARIVVPDYDACLERHYHQPVRDFGAEIESRHFGVVVDFDEAIEIEAHDRDRRLHDDLRAVVRRFGPLSLRNAYLPARDRTSDQRNVFRSLRFHIDRGSTQDDHHSMFWRDPFDPVQREPRGSSTLIMSYGAAHLQACAEGQGGPNIKMRYDLFDDDDPKPLIGSVLVELPWRAPTGVGEIALLDNRTVLHASYYPHKDLRGYPISVRYLY